jgi:formylglycine-generating enzyme required for sulfatase activity
MHGNMGEWCADLVKTQEGVPARPTRGGGWGHEAGWCRAVFRVSCPQGGRFGDIGLRLARVPDR